MGNNMKHLMYRAVRAVDTIDTPRTVGEILQTAFLAGNGSFCMSIIDGILSISIGSKVYYQGEVEK
jgi:hypothetical protein